MNIVSNGCYDNNKCVSIDASPFDLISIFQTFLTTGSTDRLLIFYYKIPYSYRCYFYGIKTMSVLLIDITTGSTNTIISNECYSTISEWTVASANLVSGHFYTLSLNCQYALCDFDHFYLTSSSSSSPSELPTALPSELPTFIPTFHPTKSTLIPTSIPTVNPTILPTIKTDTQILCECQNLVTFLKIESYCGNDINVCLMSSIFACNKLNQITKISLSSVSLTGSIPTEIAVLSNLQEMSFSHNFLLGNLPTEFGRMLKLQYFDISHNKLSGDIPTAIGEMKSLKYLDISFNSFKTGIPKSVGSLPQLSSFYIASYNGA